MLILEGVVQRDNPGVICDSQDVSFGAHVPYLVLADHGLLDHALHGVHFPIGLLLDEAHLGREGRREGRRGE